MRVSIFLLVVFVIIMSCSNSDIATLPIIGNYEVIENDTIFPKISEFNFLNQDSILVSNKTLSKHIYIADFFYSYCPTICPKVKSQMIRIHDKFEKEDGLKIISFALDPKRDNVDFLISVREDPDEPGGIYHSGKIILIDKNGHIRGFATGTDEKDVNKLMSNIKSLLKEHKK